MKGKKQLVVNLALPKGRMQERVVALLSDAGIHVSAGSRTYRPIVSLPHFEAKTLKPQNIVEMLAIGSRDIGFAGADWVAETGVDLVELLDTELDPVRIVAAAPAALLENGKLPSRSLVVASEYERLTKKWISERNLNGVFVRSFGATEVFPPEDADCIVDNTATGWTLHVHDLEIFDELMKSSTRLYANPRILEDRHRREQIEHFVLLLSSVLEARKRVMLEVNVSAENLDEVVAVLPSMREATISPLFANAGYAVKAAVPRGDLPRLIPEIKRRKGTDIVVTSLSQIVP